jgi:hypothetical protein
VGTTAQVVTLTAGSLVPAGNVVYVVAGNNGLTYDTTAVTDSKSHAWTVSVNIAQGGLQGFCIAWTVAQGNWTNTDTVTLNSTSSGPLVSRVYIMDFQPPGTVSADKVASAGAASTTAVSSGSSAATTGTDDLWVGGVQYDDAGAFTPTVLSPVWSAPTTASQQSQSQTLAQRYRNPSGSVAAVFAGSTAVAADYAAGVVALQSTPAGVSGSNTATGPGVAGQVDPQLNSRMWF